MNRRIWNDDHTIRPEAESDLRTMTAREFGEKYGVNSSLAYAIRSRLDIKVPLAKRGRRSPHAERNQEIAELRKQGWSERKIAKKFSLSHQRVNQILNRLAVEPPVPPGYTGCFGGRASERLRCCMP